MAKKQFKKFFEHKKLNAVNDISSLRGEYAKQNHGTQNFRANDEYYTSAEEVEDIFTYFIDTHQFKDKIIYCPADSEESEFVKYINVHKDEWDLKDFIYTSDDFYNHLDIFEKADFVITNPPFSLILKLLDILKASNTKYFLFGSNVNSHRYFMRDMSMRFYWRNESYPFKVPSLYGDETEKELGYALYLTNLKINEEAIEAKKKTRIFSSILKNASIDAIKVFAVYNDERFPNIDYCKNFPVDYDGYVLCPVTIINFSEYFEYDFTPCDFSYTDNKNRFVRIATKKKKCKEWDEYLSNKHIEQLI